MIKKNILAIGPLPDFKRKIFSGQSIMFDGIVKYLINCKVNTVIVDISPSKSICGIKSRIIDYIFIYFNFISKCLFKRVDVAYITSSLGRTGIYRDIVFIAILRVLHAKVILHQFGADISGVKTLNQFFRRIFSKEMDYVSAIIVEGHYIRKQFEVIPEVKEKIHVIPNGLPTEGRQSLKEKRISDSKPFIMFYLSNLIWSKGYFDVLKAVDILVNKEKLDVRCVFAGRFMSSEDDERPGISNKEDFDDYIKDHNLIGKIEYFQGLYGEEKDNCFALANVFLLPTYYVNEGQPVSILEAMSYGCVPMVTNFRHIPMMINEENGCLVEPKDPVDIAKKVKFLIENKEIYRKKSVRCISDYKQKFKFSSFADEVMNCIYSI